MKLRTETLHRRQTATPPKAVKPEPEVDYTAEGSPPPGKVGTGHPALPAVEQAEPADNDREPTHGKR